MGLDGVELLMALEKNFALRSKTRRPLLIARENEATDWKLLQNTVAARRWPELGRSRGLVILLMVLCVGISCTCLWFWI